MHKTFSALLAALLAITSMEVHQLKHPRAADIICLYDASFTVRTPNGSGSGTLFRDQHGELLILTAAHVVAEDEQVLLVQTTALVGQRLTGVAIDGDVIEVDETLDLALIRPHSAEAFSLWVQRNGSHIAKIYHSKEVPGITTPVIHIGSRLGEVGERSIEFGAISGIARRMASDGAVLDQTSAPVSPGSSGGGIFDAHTGQLIGVLVRGFTDTFSFFVPARDINRFLQNTLH